LSVSNKDYNNNHYLSEQTMGQRVSGSWVKWVNKCEWVTWVTGQYRQTPDP